MKTPTQVAADLLGWHATPFGKSVLVFDRGNQVREQRTFALATGEDAERILEETIRANLGDQGGQLLALCGRAVAAASAAQK